MSELTCFRVLSEIHLLSGMHYKGEITTRLFTILVPIIYLDSKERKQDVKMYLPFARMMMMRYEHHLPGGAIWFPFLSTTEIYEEKHPFLISRRNVFITENGSHLRRFYSVDQHNPTIQS